MINFIKNIFKKKPYTFLGRGGISFNNDGEEFYIDSNNYLGKGNDVEIFYKDIKQMNNGRILSDTEKKKIAIMVKKRLGDDGIKVDILPV